MKSYVGSTQIGGGLPAISDGDKGDITLSGSGTVWTIDNGAVTAAKVAADVATQSELDAVAATIPTTESAQDLVGAMFSGNTETGIAASYDDTNGKIDLVAEVTQSELDAEAALARNADNLTSGTIADARIPSGIARDSEVAAAYATIDEPIAAAHIADTSDAHDASAISIADAGNDFTATDVEGALAELQADHEADVTALSDHAADTTSIHGIADTSVLETTSGAQAKADAKVTQNITNGVTTTAPSEDAVFDALALKAPLASPTFTGTVTVPDSSFSAAKLSFDVATQAELDAVAGTIPNTEAIQDLVGGMVSGNTETGIAVSYDDTNGKLDFVAEVTQTELDAKADDSAVVHDTGNESIDGIKTFTSDPIIPDEAYGVGWNGSLEPPTKNAVYDKIETLSGGVSDGDKGDITVSGTGATWTVDAEAITFAKMQHIATDRLVGRDTASSGDPEEISLGYGLAFSGSASVLASLASASAFVTAETTISAATYADITGASISLAAGTWLVWGQVNIRAVNAIVQAFVAITHNDNTVISEVAASRPASGTANLNSPFSCNPIGIVTPGSTTTYKLRGARGLTTHTGSWIAMDGNGVNTTNHATNNTDKGTGIFAVRIA